MNINELAKCQVMDEEIRKFEKVAYDFDVDADKVAKEKGLKVVLPEDNQLQIDLDTEEAFDEFNRRLDWFEFEKGAYTAESHFSNSGKPHRHITLTFKNVKFEEYQRIALQAALGSDIIREYLNCKRLWKGCKNPTRLFEKP
jgi:hypothetical protein